MPFYPSDKLGLSQHLTFANASGIHTFQLLTDRLMWSTLKNVLQPNGSIYLQTQKIEILHPTDKSQCLSHILLLTETSVDV
ncbi:hypothetical protein CEXT_625361 [Caerostris extrusa]|uniref:Uncharacterized protein n=1 Tax=Caerostris extrusa TaxID=172846 RepID=A0AAV4S4W0_CAEEX|nr:hypothetical protein CEXT_625361 [Caerostris extrusa]